MNESSINPALAHMDLAQDKITTYSVLLKRAQETLLASSQAFDRANKTSITGNCQIKQELMGKLRQQYAALTNLTSAIIETLDAPMFSRIIATAPKNSPQLLALLELLPEAEKDLLNTAFSILFVLGQGEMEYLSAEQRELAGSILRLTCLET